MKLTLFNELYGCYFSTVRHILREAAGRELTGAEFGELVRRKSEQYGFPETTNMIVRSALYLGKDQTLEDNKDAWPFFDSYTRRNTGNPASGINGTRAVSVFKSRLKNVSDIPLSTLELMWLKSVCSDPRVRLFCEDGCIPELEDVEPLFDPENFVLFDRYSDGDPFRDEHYIEMFRKVLSGLHNQSCMKIVFRKPNHSLVFNRDGIYEAGPDRGTGTVYIDPDHLEYSERDDKFRLVGSSPGFGRSMVNIASIVSCEEADRFFTADGYDADSRGGDLKREVVFRLRDDNNSLERFLLHFSHYEKEAEYLRKEKLYQIKMTYDETDETDVVIRVLSFGPHVKAVDPPRFTGLIRDRLQSQEILRRS